MNDSQTFKSFYTKGNLLNCLCFYMKMGFPTEYKNQVLVFIINLLHGIHLQKNFMYRLARMNFIKANNILDSLEWRID